MEAKQIAAKLLAQGEKLFANEKGEIVVEIATKQFLADDTLPAGIGGWKEFVRIRPVKKKVGEIVDLAVDELAGTKPGSQERIAKMAELYAPAVDEIAKIAEQYKGQNSGEAMPEPENQPSAWNLSLDDLSDKWSIMMMGDRPSTCVLLIHLPNIGDVPTHTLIKQHRRKPLPE